MASALPLHLLSATELVAGFRARRFSPVEATRGCLAAVDARNADLNAFLVVLEEGALAQARASETRWHAGAPKGLLDGVPVTVKDLCQTAGVPSRNGSRTTSDAPGTVDAPCVARLREAGAVLLGKTAMCEFGWKGVTDSALLGVSRNPWDRERSCGGSSGGAAIAAATGMGALHVGSDGAGSIRIPAAFCGVVGLKPTFGRVPTWPPGRVAVGHYGPLARTVEDAALALTVIARPDARDWTALPYVEGTDWRHGLDAGVRGLRIAWCPTLCGAQADAEILHLTREAVDVLAALGAQVEEVASPIASPRGAFDVLWMASMAQVLRKVPAERRAWLDPGFVAVAQRGLGVSVDMFLDATGARQEDGATMNAFHRRFDVLVTPQMPTTAIAAGVDFPPDAGMTSWLDWSPYTYPFNWTQQPALSFPCGIASDGLPVALQVVGARYAEGMVLRVAKALENAMGSGRLPPGGVLGGSDGPDRPDDQPTPSSIR